MVGGYIIYEDITLPVDAGEEQGVVNPGIYNACKKAVQGKLFLLTGSDSLSSPIHGVVMDLNTEIDGNPIYLLVVNLLGASMSYYIYSNDLAVLVTD